MHVLILSLDTSSQAGSIAFAEDGRLLAVISTASEETYSSRIFRQLEFLLSELALTLDRFDLFAVNGGPGSFTGLRVGLTTAKAWAESFSKPVVAISGLEAVAAQTFAVSRPIIPVIDARRGELYAGYYRIEPQSPTAAATLTAAGEDAVMTPDEFLSWLAEFPSLDQAILATPSAAWLASVLPPGSEAPQRQICEVSPVLAPTIAKLAYQRALRGETVDALRLDANYVRRSDAELNWKGK